MFVVCVTSWVKPEHIGDYIRACEANATATRSEPGNLRFDFLRCIEPDNQFFFYEVYQSEADFKFHHQQPHYLAWREAITDWMEKPREGVRYQSLLPTDPQSW